ncbi:hypothetical protein SAMN05216233_13217 [Desulfoluna spongiiphila]|uniref:Uncharacterized protein n=1 Tax=Desulfoluna spongiiphila TaxID=419481 RepID=A0A1G5JKW7_9BACT|nr:hypothetical protein SAMN05216233_13217 [Desulfoluna spongiiphila]
MVKPNYFKLFARGLRRPMMPVIDCDDAQGMQSHWLLAVNVSPVVF